MLALLRLEDHAYGVTVRQEIELGLSASFESALSMRPLVV